MDELDGHYEFWKAGSHGNWRWHYVKNGRIIADSGESYKRKRDCLRGIEIMRGSAKAKLVEL